MHSFYLASLYKDVLPRSHEISCVKAWFKLCGHALPLWGQLEAFLLIWKGVVLAIQLVTHLWFRCSGPPSPSLEVVLNEGAVGTVLKEPWSHGHRSFNNLITNHKEKVSIEIRHSDTRYISQAGLCVATQSISTITIIFMTWVVVYNNSAIVMITHRAWHVTEST